jgi:hypothetical protein
MYIKEKRSASKVNSLEQLRANLANYGFTIRFTTRFTTRFLSFAAHRIRYSEARERGCLNEYYENTRHVTLERVQAWLQGTSAGFGAS